MATRKKTTFIVLHCTATRAAQPVHVSDVRAWHKARGWTDIGYAYLIPRKGATEKGRSVTAVGAHVGNPNPKTGRSWNEETVGVALAGGLNNVTGKPENNYDPEQWENLRVLIKDLLSRFPGAKILGHRDLSPDKNKSGIIEPHEYLKACPCFDARAWARGNGFPAAPARL